MITDLPTDLVEYIFKFLSIEELYKIGWVLLGKDNYKKYWEKYQLLNWRDSLMPGPSVINKMYNKSLLNFIYTYYWDLSKPIPSEIGENIPLCICSKEYKCNDHVHMLSSCDTIICLLKFMPYDQKKFQQFLECAQNLPYNDESIQDSLALSKSQVCDLEIKINHMVDYINKNNNLSLATFSWDSYDRHPKLLIPLLENIESDVNDELIGIFAHQYNKYKILITHFYPFIRDDILKQTLEQSLILCRSSLNDIMIQNNTHLDMNNISTILREISHVSARRLETVLETIPDKYGMLVLGNDRHVNEMGVIFTIHIVNAKTLSRLHIKIISNLLLYYFKLWFANFYKFSNEDQDILANVLRIMGESNIFQWCPNNYFEYALSSQNSGLINYVVDKIPNITTEHCKTLDNYPTSPAINEYLFARYSLQKYSEGINSTNIILFICILIFILCLVLLLRKNQNLDIQTQYAIYHA